MGALGQDVAEPEADQRANTGALPGPVGCDMGVNHVADAHLLDDPKEEGDTVDLFIREPKSGGGRFHSGWCDKAHCRCGTLCIGETHIPSPPGVGRRLTILPHCA